MAQETVVIQGTMVCVNARVKVVRDAATKEIEEILDVIDPGECESIEE